MTQAVRAAAILGLIVLGGCTKREERLVTQWLKIDISRPRTGSSGVVVLGSNQEMVSVKMENRWVRLGTGHATSYMVLAEDQAALIDLHDGGGVQLVSENRPPRRAGDVSVPPDREAIDRFECRIPATPTGCREALIERSDVSGTVIASFTVALPDAYSDCQQLRINGYDRERIPYVFGQCRPDSAQAKCVLMAPRKDAPYVYAVGVDQPWSECSDLSHAGVTLSEPARYDVIY
jgi:hypothetical protein